MTPNDMEIVEMLPSPEDFNRLRNAVGWGRIDEDLVKTGLANSLYGLCVRNSEGIVGFVRLVGDGALKIYVEELIIDPQYQHRGLGTQLMDRIMVYIRAHYRKGCSVGLFANTGLGEYYSRFGFIERRAENPGMQYRL